MLPKISLAAYAAKRKAIKRGIAIHVHIDSCVYDHSHKTIISESPKMILKHLFIFIK